MDEVKGRKCGNYCRNTSYTKHWNCESWSFRILFLYESVEVVNRLPVSCKRSLLGVKVVQCKLRLYLVQAKFLMLG